MTVLLPQNLDMEQKLKAYPPIIKNFKQEDMFYILGLICSVPANNKEHMLNEYIPLSSTVLQKINHNYKPYIRYLIYRGIWDCDASYIKGKKCMGYKFSKKYEDAKLIPYKISNGRAERKAKKEKKNHLPAKYRHLANHFDGLEIDVAAAEKYVEEYTDFLKAYPQYKKKKVTIRCKDGSTYPKTVEKMILPKHFYGCTLLNIHSFADKDFSLTVDETGNRLHTPLTNLKKELRNFITYKGKTLVSIDIKNSQPFMALKLLDPNFYLRKGKNSKLCQTHFANSTQIQASIQGLNNNHFIMLVKSLSDPLNTDVSMFIVLVTSGTFYEYFMEKVQEHLGESITREVAKDTMFRVLFTANGFYNHPEAKYKRIFAKEFPNVYRLFESIKKGNKPLLAVLLQNIESKLILDVICARIRKENPHIPLYTIHDSITTTVENEVYVKAVIEEEVQKHVGYKPKLMPEYWKPENAYKSLYKKLEKVAA